MTQVWTTAQAAFIVGKPLDIFQKTVERMPIKPALSPRRGRKVRIFELRDLVFFCALDTLREDLTVRKQAELYRALRRIPPGVEIGDVEIGRLTYNLDPYVHRIRKEIAATEKLLDLIDTSGREPLIKGTSVEAYRVAALVEDMTVEEILSDYPSLVETQVRAARAYAQANPKVGRPYPTMTAKKALRTSRVQDADTFLPSRG